MGLRSRRKLVRVHLETEPHVQVQSLDGVLWGRVAGHLVLRKPSVVAGEGASVELDGPEVLVPVDRVLFVQVLR